MSAHRATHSIVCVPAVLVQKPTGGVGVGFSALPEAVPVSVLTHRHRLNLFLVLIPQPVCQL